MLSKNLRAARNRARGLGVDPLKEGGEAGHQSVLSPLPPSDILHRRLHPRTRETRGVLLRGLIGAVDFGFAFMRTPLQMLAMGALLLLDAASADAADCMCDRISAEGCSEAASIRNEPVAPPLWCERSDDPRCMPANTHGTTVHTLVPVVMSWAQPIRWDAPPRTGVLMDVIDGGDARTEHSRRVERPPR
jgi:hypothetical protein